MTTTLSGKGQIVLPKALREQDDLRPGDDFVVERIGPGRIVLQRIGPTGGKARLTIGTDGLPIIKSPRRAPVLTSAKVKELEAEIFE